MLPQYSAASAAAMVLLSLSALLSDLKRGRIPNALTGSFLVLSVILRLVSGSLPGLLELLAGLFVPLLLLFPAFRFGMLGAGDVKLLSVLGSFLSGTGALLLVFFSLLAGSVQAAARLTRQHLWKARFSYFFRYVRETAVSGRIRRYRRDGAHAENIHFALPVFLAVLLMTGGPYVYTASL